jgi:uncharacterized repeat protein (TIGR01451 family)
VYEFITQARIQQILSLSRMLVVLLLLLPIPSALSHFDASRSMCAPSSVRHQASQGLQATCSGPDLLYSMNIAKRPEVFHPFISRSQIFISSEDQTVGRRLSPIQYPKSDAECPNGGFESGDFSCWSFGGNLPSSVQSDVKLEGNYAALLGDPDPAKCEGGLEIGSAWISQTLWIPPCGDSYLSFFYRIRSYDQYDKSFENLYDTFDVYIDDLSDNAPKFLILRDGSNEEYDCDLAPYDSDWVQRIWQLGSVTEFEKPDRLHDLRGKQVALYFYNFSRDPGYNNAWYNTWAYIDNVKIEYSPLMLQKSSLPSGPVHEGDVITYTISYANTGLITQTNVVITDKIPSNTDLVIGSISPGGRLMQNGVISWTIGSLAVCERGAVSFQVRIPLLRHLDVESVSPLCPPTPPPPPARVLPAAISCDTTRFWASGVTRQPPVSPPYTIEVQLPPNTSPSEMWLLMKGTDNTAPRVEGQPAQVLTSTHTAFGASVWTATVTSAMIEAGEVTVVTDNPRELNALFLFDAKDPPFDERDLRVFAEAPTTFTYTLEIPSVEASSMDVLLPFMDITSWTDSSPPEFDGRLITVSVKLEGEPTQAITVNQPNMGNGLLMTQFPINLRPFTDTITKTKVLTISVDSEDDTIYTLGPRVCRPVYVENTAWLCSKEAGCISDTTRNIPEDFAPLSVYLPIILKSSP